VHNQIDLFCGITEIVYKQLIKEEKTMGRTSNDHRSDSMNPNNDAYWDSLDNHANQLNPNNDEYKGGNSKDDDE